MLQHIARTHHGGEEAGAANNHHQLVTGLQAGAGDDIAISLLEVEVHVWISVRVLVRVKVGEGGLECLGQTVIFF